MSASPVSPAPSDAVLADTIRTQRLRFVFIQSAIPTLFSPLAAAVLAVALREAVDQTVLLGWVLLLLVIAFGRVVLVRSYPTTDPDMGGVRRWERTFIASIMVVDLTWGFGALYLMPESLALQALVFATVMMMAAGHASSFAAHPQTVILGVLAIAGPITVAFALKGDVFHGALVTGAVMYLAALLRSLRTLSTFFARNLRLAHELLLAKEHAERLARLDFLTELFNRRAYYESAERVLHLAKRHGRATSVLMLDIDHFKSINDRHGHATGDEALKAMAAMIRATNRDSDVVGRLGGEEFAILLPETALDDARVIAERLRQRVEAHVLPLDTEDLRFTTSIGVAQARADETLEALLARADLVLYEAKHAGRNRVVTG